MRENRSKENYLKTIYILSRKKEVRSYHIADEMGFSRPSVCNALKELEKDGLVYTEDDHVIKLTEKGFSLARDTYECNQIFRNLLLQLGVSEENACQDACEVEHLLSNETVHALKMWSVKNKLSHFT